MLWVTAERTRHPYGFMTGKNASMIVSRQSSPEQIGEEYDILHESWRVVLKSPLNTKKFIALIVPKDLNFEWIYTHQKLSHEKGTYREAGRAATLTRFRRTKE